MAATLNLRVDGEALEVAVLRRGPGNGERDGLGVVTDAELAVRGDAVTSGVDRSSPADLGELGGIVSPCAAEGGTVDHRGVRELVASQRARGSLTVAGGDGLYVGIGEIGAQQHEAIGDLEPRGFEASGGP